ncbi:DNA ligase D [Thermoleophilia bacterium SCSIO 60948]|nr:DNA ligase D [Thermoleophilia bacterium SCSIO 60948]
MARRKLEDYERKRSFDSTTEPRGSEDAAASERPRFVIQEHHATRLHWDLRLEHEGVLASWALPKGVPDDPKQNRLAVRTEDHPLEYLEFHGEIPAGNYGAGTMTIWDSGTYEVEKFRDNEVMVVFHGERVRGRYVLFPTDGRNWMIHRMDPKAADSGEPLPERVEPMKATLADPPRDDSGWGFEIKWDGVRALAYCVPGDVRLQSRSMRDITRQYPEVRGIAEALGSRPALLDGEIVAFDSDGRPDFQALQTRMHVADEAKVRKLRERVPVEFVAFDVLHLDGRSLLDEPYERRRELLEGLDLDGEHWRTPAYHRGDGAALIEASAAQGLEGVMAKRLASRYTPGRRSRDWLKLKNLLAQEFVVGGWLQGQGRREGTVGALLVGYYEDDPGEDREGLRYAGRVGTGFTEQTLAELRELLAPLARESSPFEGRQPPKESRFVEPEVVAEVAFGEWTKADTLRAPRFRGLRDDKPASEVRREVPDHEAAERPAEAPATRRGADGPRGSRPLGGEADGATNSLPSPGFEIADGLVEVDGRELKLTNTGKVLYPAAGFTKGDVIDYYARIAPVLLPHLEGRPLTLKRYPNGVDAPHFYEKQCPRHRPDWMRTIDYDSGSRGETITFCEVAEPAALVWTSNLADLELHVSLARGEAMERPTTMVLDLDPGPGTGLAECCDVALDLRELLDGLGLASIIKSSGSKGLHLHVPLNGEQTYDEVSPFAHAVARMLAARRDDVVTKMTKSIREGRVLVDWSQNSRHKTTVGVFSLRAKERPTVAAPLAWAEVEEAHSSGDTDALVVDSERMLAEAAERAEHFRPALELEQVLPGF